MSTDYIVKRFMVVDRERREAERKRYEDDPSIEMPVVFKAKAENVNWKQLKPFKL